MAPTQIELIVNEALIICAHIEKDGQRIGWADTAKQRVEGDFANRDGHATDAQISKTQNPLSIGHDNHINPIFRPISDHLLHLVFHRVGEIESFWIEVIGTILDSRLTYCRSINDRKH